MSNRMKPRKKKPEQQPQPSPQERELSEIIQDFAEDFIELGETLEEREGNLNAACSAWNIACNLPEYRKKNLDHYLREYATLNPDSDEEQLEAVRENMEILIERKIQTFTHDLREIIGARIVDSGDKEWIEVASAEEE